MSKVAIFIKHKALPGKRDEVKRVWERYMSPLISQNENHEAYFYCYDDNDPDSICVYQQYSDYESAQAFLKNPDYATYLKESRLLLAEESEITTTTPVWVKTV